MLMVMPLMVFSAGGGLGPQGTSTGAPARIRDRPMGDKVGMEHGTNDGVKPDPGFWSALKGRFV